MVFLQEQTSDAKKSTDSLDIARDQGINSSALDFLGVYARAMSPVTS